MENRTLAALALVTLLAPACAGAKQRKDGPAHVDALLGRVEQVQVESVLARERAHGAYDALSALAAPGFQGDAVVAYQHLVEAVDQSVGQASSFAAAIAPMKEAANELFLQWTADLEAFGGSSMRARSQARLEETRARYESVLTAAVAAKIAFDAYNSELRDQALFLEHDFNASSIALVAAELGGLESRGLELGRRLDLCARATRAYVESAALPGQLAPAEEPVARDTASLRAGAEPASPAGPAAGTN